MSAMNRITLRQWLDVERGRRVRLALLLGIDPVLVGQYADTRQVPKDRAPDVEFFTNGEVSCEVTRPDVVWLRVPDARWPHPSGRPTIDAATAHLRGLEVATPEQRAA